MVLQYTLLCAATLFETLPFFITFQVCDFILIYLINKYLIIFHDLFINYYFNNFKVHQLSNLTFQFLFWVILPQIYPRIPFLSKTYASLSPMKQREVCGTTCAIFHACSAVLLSFDAVLFENQLEIGSLTGISMEKVEK